MSFELGLEYKRRAQAKMHERCRGDMEKFSQLCAESVTRLEREGGFKFKRGVPAGWTAPEIEWPAPQETGMALRESVGSKKAAPHIGNPVSPVSYAKSPRKKSKAATRHRA